MNSYAILVINVRNVCQYATSFVTIKNPSESLAASKVIKVYKNILFHRLISRDVSKLHCAEKWRVALHKEKNDKILV